MRPYELPQRAEVLDSDSVLDHFERAWQSGSPPDIAEFLPPAPQQSTGEDARRELLGELVMIDLWYRWSRPPQGNCGLRIVDCGLKTVFGQFTIHNPKSTMGCLPDRPCLEDYLRQYPELGPSDRLPVSLIGEEYRVRRRWGDRPDHESYRSRFSKQAAALEEILAEIDSEAVPDTAVPSEPTVPLPAEAGAETASSASGEQPSSGEAIGKYHVIGVLDEGGQAQVYRAVHPTLAKELVIKIARNPLRGNQADPGFLVAEGKVLAELEHPNLARIYDLDFHQGRPFLVMEYVRGRNLWQYARQQKPSPRESARLVAGVARALAVAHGRGVIHQDIKPANIIIDESEQPRVIDFGLARLRHAWADDSATPGSISGTVQYMAPEQARGQTDRVDQRSDVFALGAVLYYLLVGQAPFADRTAMDSLERASECRFDALALRKPEIPRRLAAVCLRAMQAEPDDRYAKADDLAEDLERFIGRPRRLRKIGAFAAGVVVVLLAGIGLWTLAGNARGPTPPGVIPREQPKEEARLLPDYLDWPLSHDFRIRFELLGNDGEGSKKVTLTEGQRVAFRVEVDRDCYVGVWHVDAQGQVSQLFPNQHDADNFIPAGQPRTIPGELDYAIRATPSSGPEFLHVVASTERWESRAGQHMGPYVVFATPQERAKWKEQVRGLSIEDDARAAVSELLLPFEVLPR